MGRPSNLKYVSDELLFAVCERFIKDGMSPKEVSEWLEANFREECELLRSVHKVKFTSHKVYPLLREALHRSLIVLNPPTHEALAKDIRTRYLTEKADEKKFVTVVDVGRAAAAEQVAHVAAKILVDRIKHLGKKKNKVGLGIGAGFTTHEVMRHLAHLLRAEPRYPNLVLHALSSGFESDRPESSPVAFLSFFDREKVEGVGLFAPAVVETGDFEKLKKFPGIREAFSRKQEIDIVISSLAQRDDEHGLLNRFLDLAKPPKATGRPAEAPLPPVDATIKEALQDMREELLSKKWVGDVAFHPFSNDAFLELKAGVRAMTLFSLSELARLAERDDRFVMLIAGPCGTCHQTKGKALQPLLANRRLHMWNILVLDKGTAGEVLSLHPPSATA